MENGLPGHLAHIHPDVEPLHLGVILEDVGSKPVNQLGAGFPFIGSESEEIRNMATRNHQGVQRGDREGIPD